MLALRYLVANAAWVFVFGDSLLRMGDGPMFFGSRRDAVAAAAGCGLKVSRSGVVSS